jgi:hypothetical protein
MKKEYIGKTFSNILVRILIVTINNAFNNNTLMENFNRKFRKLVTEIIDKNSIISIFCLIYVIQLAVKIMMGRLNIEIKNNSKKVNWESDKVIEEIN